MKVNLMFMERDNFNKEIRDRPNTQTPRGPAVTKDQDGDVIMKNSKVTTKPKKEYTEAQKKRYEIIKKLRAEKKCFKCQKTGHIKKDCPNKKVKTAVITTRTTKLGLTPKTIRERLKYRQCQTCRDKTYTQDSCEIGYYKLEIENLQEAN